MDSYIALQFRDYTFNVPCAPLLGKTKGMGITFGFINSLMSLTKYSWLFMETTNCI